MVHSMWKSCKIIGLHICTNFHVVIGRYGYQLKAAPNQPLQIVNLPMREA